jgi:hypothetical protein
MPKEAPAIECNAPERRCEPASDARMLQTVNDDVKWVILCPADDPSSLAAAVLQKLGLHRATDAVGADHALAAYPPTPRIRHPRRLLLTWADVAERLWDACRHAPRGPLGIASMGQLHRNRRPCCGG